MASRFFKFLRPAPAPVEMPATCAATLEEARSLQRQGRIVDAILACEAALRSSPDDIDGLLCLAELSALGGRSDRALEYYSRVIALRPDAKLAHYKRGNLLKDRGLLEEAISSYDEAIRLDPGHAFALCNKGVVLALLNRPDAALQSYDQALAADPADALAWFNRGGVLRSMGRSEEALASYDRAIAAQPNYVEAHCNRGVLLEQLGRPQDALASYARAIELHPQFSAAYFGRGVARQKLGRDAEALADFNRVLELDPANAAAYCNRAVALMALGRTEPALADLDRALALEPDSAEAHASRGRLLATLRQHDAAVESFDRAIALQPSRTEIHENRAVTLVQMMRFVPAIESYSRVLELEPDRRFALGMLRYAKMNVCDWSDLPKDLESLRADISAGRAVSTPFPMLALIDDPRLHHRNAQIWVRHTCPSNSDLPPLARRQARPKLRVGYFSGDFREHPVAMLLAEVFERHDRSKIELMAFSYGPPVQDAVRRRLDKTFDRFVDIRGRLDLDVARMTRELEIDVAVDLAGYTGGSPTAIFAQRAAPVQINYLGYPGTMASDYFDYLIADSTVIPPESRTHFSEKIIYLPHSYLPHDSTVTVTVSTPARKDLGLPAEGFIYCCFNNSYKITPDVFDSWMRILDRVPGSVLWLSQQNPVAAANLRKQAARCGIAADRMIFAQRVPLMADHLARHRVAGLFLDTLPYNAHTTAIDALWMGLPVITRQGHAFAGRVAASLLRSTGLDELITSTTEQYEELAVQLALNPQRLAGIKIRLVESRRTARLFDAGAFAAHLESAYLNAYTRYQSGLPPDHIDLSPDSSSKPQSTLGQRDL